MPETRNYKERPSGVPGVTWDIWKERWRGRITADGRHKHIGWFDSVEAARAAIETARLYQKLAGEERKERVHTTLVIDGKPVRGMLTIGYGRITFETQTTAKAQTAPRPFTASNRRRTPRQTEAAAQA